MSVELSYESNQSFWARVNLDLDKTGIIKDEDADQIFARAEIEIEELIKQIYISTKVREKKLVERDRLYESEQKEFIKKFGGAPV